MVIFIIVIFINGKSSRCSLYDVSCRVLIHAFFKNI
mgnify:CR=1 FL=1